jgi:hypothetical protein
MYVNRKELFFILETQLCILIGNNHTRFRTHNHFSILQDLIKIDYNYDYEYDYNA